MNFYIRQRIFLLVWNYVLLCISLRMLFQWYNIYQCNAKVTFGNRCWILFIKKYKIYSFSEHALFHSSFRNWRNSVLSIRKWRYHVVLLIAEGWVREEGRHTTIWNQLFKDTWGLDIRFIYFLLSSLIIV